MHLSSFLRKNTKKYVQASLTRASQRRYVCCVLLASIITKTVIHKCLLLYSQLIKTNTCKTQSILLFQTTNVAKLVSEEWRALSPEERDVWEEKARKDKARYQVEKAMYKGPWKVPNMRKQKHPNAPKRPMSAFLAFSNSRRASIKRSNPAATNADISKTLSRMWKEAPEALRKKYLDEEAKLREEYKIRIAEWRKKAAEEEGAERKQREDIARRTAERRESGDLDLDDKSSNAAASSISAKSQTFPLSTVTMSSSQNDMNGNVALLQQQQQRNNQANQMIGGGLNQMFIDHLASSGTLAATNHNIGLPGNLREKVVGLHHQQALTGRLNNILHNSHLNEVSQQIPSISETYQAMLPSLIGKVSAFTVCSDHVVFTNLSCILHLSLCRGWPPESSPSGAR